MEIQIRNATMRHTATLEVMLAFNRDKATAGANLANAVEMLLDWSHLDAAALRDELRKLLEDRKTEIKMATEARDSLGASVDAVKFSDEQCPARFAMAHKTNRQGWRSCWLSNRLEPGN